MIDPEDRERFGSCCPREATNLDLESVVISSVVFEIGLVVEFSIIVKMFSLLLLMLLLSSTISCEFGLSFETLIALNSEIEIVFSEFSVFVWIEILP